MHLTTKGSIKCVFLDKIPCHQEEIVENIKFQVHAYIGVLRSRCLRKINIKYVYGINTYICKKNTLLSCAYEHTFIQVFIQQQTKKTRVFGNR